MPISVWGIYTVWRRHFKVYTKTLFVNCLAPISEPVIYLIAFGYGLSPLIGTLQYGGKNVSYLEFMAPGMVAVGCLFQAFFEGGYGTFIRLRYQKTWQALLTAPLSYTDIFLGDWCWATSKGLLAGLVTGLVAVLWGAIQPLQLITFLPLLILGSVLFAALGLLTAGLVRTVDQINIPVFLLIIPMFTLCGTYFPRETLPLPLQLIASILPLASLVDLLRWDLGKPEFWELKLAWLLILTLAFGYAAARSIRRQLFRS